MKELQHSDILEILPNRRPDSHKGDYGRVLLLCGSRGYTGAAAMAAMGALRSGAGMVYLAVPESIYVIEAVKLTEPVVLPMPDANGMFSSETSEQLVNLLPKMDAVLIGPGIGCSDGTYVTVKYILEQFNGPVILDADGINVLQGHIDILRGRTSPTILTPHIGEFRRLSDHVSSDRISDAIHLATDTGTVVLLKGNKTVITDGNDVYVNPTGNPGMAVGGSGDVLGGIIAALLGQGISPILAAACGAWLHGAAGDICAEQIGQYGMLPTDMLQVLPRLLK